MRVGWAHDSPTSVLERRHPQGPGSDEASSANALSQKQRMAALDEAELRDLERAELLRRDTSRHRGCALGDIDALKASSTDCFGVRASRSLPLLERSGSVHAARLKQQGLRLPLLHLRDAHLDPSFARVRVAGRVDPANPLPSRHRRDVAPDALDLPRSRIKRRSEIRRHARLGPLLGHPDVDRRGLDLR